MGRAPRISFPGAKYHTMARGNWRAEIFSSPADYARFLMQLRDAASNEGVIIYAYALMNNHYHLFIETPQANVSRFMQRLNTAYSLYFRNRTQKPGHCFQGRYACQLVTGNAYCLRLTRYIHLNPIKTSHYEKASAAEKWHALKQYEWTSLHGYLDASQTHDWIDYRWLALCGGATPRDVSGHAKPTIAAFPVQTPPSQPNATVSGLEKSGAAKRNPSFQWPDTSTTQPHRPDTTTRNAHAPTQRERYARYLLGCLDGDDQLIREDHETGQLLDQSPIGEEDSGIAMSSDVAGREDHREVSGHGKPAVATFPVQTPPSQPSATVSGLEKSGCSEAKSGVFNGLTPAQPSTTALTPSQPKPMPFDIITRAVAQAFAIPESALFAHGLHAAVAKASAIELACRFTGLTQCDVAARFGYRSESSVGKQRQRLRMHMIKPDMQTRFKAAETQLLALSRAIDHDSTSDVAGREDHREVSGHGKPAVATFPVQTPPSQPNARCLALKSPGAAKQNPEFSTA